MPSRCRRWAVLPPTAASHWLSATEQSCVTRRDFEWLDGTPYLWGHTIVCIFFISVSVSRLGSRNWCWQCCKVVFCYDGTYSLDYEDYEVNRRICVMKWWQKMTSVWETSCAWTPESIGSIKSTSVNLRLLKSSWVVYWRRRSFMAPPSVWDVAVELKNYIALATKHVPTAHQFGCDRSITMCPWMISASLPRKVSDIQFHALYSTVDHVCLRVWIMHCGMAVAWFYLRDLCKS